MLTPASRGSCSLTEMGSPMRLLLRSIALIGLLVEVPGVAHAQTVVYSQTSIAGSTGREPGMYDQFGLLVVSAHRDFYQIFTNTGPEVAVNRAVVWGNVVSVSKAVIVPVVPGVANGLFMLVPDRDPAHVLSEATIYPTTPGAFGPIEIVFSKPVLMTTGMKLAFGFIAPLERVVDATLFGTDTLPNDLTSDTPPYYTGTYFTNAAGTAMLAVGNHYLEIKSVPPPGDFNGDGQPDILWHNQTNGLLYVWFMNGTTRTGGAYLSPSSVSPDWQVRGVGDFNADGTSEILWHNQTDGTLHAWFMNGTARTGGGNVSPSIVLTDWQIGQVADFDGDGKSDIVFHNQTDGTLCVWFMNGTTRTSGAYLSPSSVSRDWQIRQQAP